MSKKPGKYEVDIMVDGIIYRLCTHAPTQTLMIKMKTDKGSGGWKTHLLFPNNTAAKAEWDEMWERRYVTDPDATLAVAKVAPVKRDIVSFLDVAFISDYNAEVAEFKATSSKFAELTLRIGLRLEFVKSQLKHGQLNKWIEEHGGISIRHARRCRDLAKVFIEAQQIGEDEMFALVDPENSKEALIKKLEQLAFDFIGEDSQAELFAKYGIQVREPKALGGHHPKQGEPATAEELEELQRQDANESVGELCHLIQRVCLGETRAIIRVEIPLLKVLEGDLIDSINQVRNLIKAG